MSIRFDLKIGCDSDPPPLPASDLEVGVPLLPLLVEVVPTSDLEAGAPPLLARGGRRYLRFTAPKVTKVLPPSLLALDRLAASLFPSFWGLFFHRARRVMWSTLATLSSRHSPAAATTTMELPRPPCAASGSALGNLLLPHPSCGGQQLLPHRSSCTGAGGGVRWPEARRHRQSAVRPSVFFPI
jgi:hypothetical protein